MANTRNWSIVSQMLLAQYEAEANAHIAKLPEHELQVIQEVCNIFDLPLPLIFVNRRNIQIIQARNMAIFRLMQLFNGTLAHYGKVMFLRPVDHTGVLNAKNTFKNDHATNEAIQRQYKELCLRTSQTEKIEVTLPNGVSLINQMELIIEKADGNHVHIKMKK